MERKPPEKPDLSEKGAARDGVPQTSDRRLFMQLLALSEPHDHPPALGRVSDMLAKAISNGGAASGGVDAVLYEDLNDPLGMAILTMTSHPGQLLSGVRQAIRSAVSTLGLTLKPEFTMLGRSYALGYEPDLEETLITRPRRTALNPAWPWAVWYPLRRSGAFAQLPPDEQRAILGEHGILGRAFGEADYAHDIRLMCHGLDKSDNDFVIGLMSKDLFPLSALVQTMRKTKQTSLYLERLGPFFVGRAVWRSTSV